MHSRHGSGCWISVENAGSIINSVWFTADAMQETFNKRKTELPTTTPLPLTQDFASDPVNHSKWRAFLNKNDIGYVPTDFRQIISRLKNFLMAPIRHTTENDAAELAWGPKGPWN
jgi:hypothetical protein